VSIQRRTLAVALLGGAALALAGPSCGSGFTESAEVVRTATIALGRETTFLVDIPVDLVVEGHPRSTDLVYTLKATVTASTASVAQGLAEAVKLSTQAEDARGIRLVAEGLEPKNGQVRGVLKVQLPDDMDLFLIGHATVEVHEVEGALQVAAAGHALVEGAVGNVSVGSQAGNALVAVNPLPGSLVEILAVRGDVQLTVPTAVSAQVVASPGGGGQLVVRHPAFPTPLNPAAPYAVSVGGGLSQITLTTQVGNIVIQ
jgi:hypothetical protein